MTQKIPELLPKLVKFLTTNTNKKFPYLELQNKHNQTIRFILNKTYKVVFIDNGYPVSNPKRVYYGKFYLKDQSKIYFSAKTNLNTKLGIVHLLSIFLSSPSAYAKQYADREQQCMFCHKKLTNLVSIYYGYGQICANNYLLPYDAKVPPHPQLDTENKMDSWRQKQASVAIAKCNKILASTITYKQLELDLGIIQ